MKLRLSEQLAGRDPAKAKEMLATLQNDTSEALENLRDLARGIVGGAGGPQEDAGLVNFFRS